jgi:hypothetical protein
MSLVLALLGALRAALRSHKSLNHLNLEYAASHGQSSYGQQSIARPGRTTSLAAPYSKSLLLHWNVFF